MNEIRILEEGENFPLLWRIFLAEDMFPFRDRRAGLDISRKMLCRKSQDDRSDLYLAVEIL